MFDGGNPFEVTCVHCSMRLLVFRIRDAEAKAMVYHLRERHLGLRTATATLGEVLDHFRVTRAETVIEARDGSIFELDQRP